MHLRTYVETTEKNLYCTVCCKRLVCTHSTSPSCSYFRCEVANISDGCDKLTMMESQPETRMDTFGDSYLMSDPKWHGFQENVVCAFRLPRKPGHRWQLWLMKHFAIDPIECGNPCRCGCEDHVHFEQESRQSSQMQTFCDFVPGGGERLDGWCGHSYGPDNVQGVQPFRAGTVPMVYTVRMYSAIVMYCTCIVYLRSCVLVLLNITST